MLTENTLVTRTGRCVAPFALCCLALFFGAAHAGDDDRLEAPLFRFSGFATLGAVYNDSDDVDFVRDLSQPSGPRGEWSTLPDTILGGQVTIQPNAHWKAVFQAVSRYDYTSNYDPRLTWGFLKYAPDPDFTVRLGRVGYDAYMQGDSRNVGYSFLTARQPIEYFGSLELTYFDGADFVYKWPIGSGLLTAKMFGGIADEELGNGYDLDDSKLYGGYLGYEWWNWQFRAGAATIKLENAADNLVPLLAGLRASGAAGRSLADELELADSRLTNWNLGFYYDQGMLQGHLLYNRRQSESRALADADSLYALVAFRVSNLTPYTGYAYTNAKSTRVLIGQPFDSALDPVFRGALLEQRSWLLGMRYDFAEKMDLKFQMDVVEAPDSRGGYFPDVDPDWDGDALIFSITFDAVF